MVAQVHSGCDPIAMLAVALPLLLVATGAMVTGALAALLLLVPQRLGAAGGQVDVLDRVVRHPGRRGTGGQAGERQRTGGSRGSSPEGPTWPALTSIVVAERDALDGRVVVTVGGCHRWPNSGAGREMVTVSVPDTEVGRSIGCRRWLAKVTW